MKKWIGVLTLFLIVGSASAQDLYWGLKAGVIGNQFVGKSLIEGTEGCCSGYSVEVTKVKPGIGGSFGAFFEYGLGGKGALRPEINIQYVGQQIDFDYREGPMDNGALNDSIQSVNSLSYRRTLVEIPLLIKAMMGKSENSYLVFGVYASQLLGETIKGEQVTTTQSPTTMNPDVVVTLNDNDILSEMIKGDGGIVLGYGIHLPAGANAFEAELRFRQGFWNQFAGSDFKVNMKNTAVMLNAAYVFDLNGE